MVSHFVLCREVVLGIIRGNERLGPSSVSFVERLFPLCLLLEGSFIGGSTVIIIITLLLLQRGDTIRCID